MRDVDVLTIAIPTYNRANYLSRLLDSIVYDIDKAKLPIKIFISDNASTDNTAEVVRKYQERFAFIDATKNEVNLGPDKNIANCYIESKSKFVWIIGDDDYLVPGSLARISAILNSEQSIDLMYMRAQPHISDLNYTSVSKLSYQECDDRYIISELVGIQYTFISSIIVNKSKHNVPSTEVYKFLATNLVQLSWVLESVSKGSNFIYVATPVVITEVDNSGGYRFLDVFGRNFSSIVQSMVGTDKRLSKTLLLSGLMFILHYHYVRNAFDSEKEKLSDTLKAFSSLSIARTVFKPLLNTKAGSLAFKIELLFMRMKKMILRILLKMKLL